MTGFGKCVVNSTDNAFTVEIRTLNSKQLDINLRLPISLKEYELEIRNILSKKIVRGKTDISISFENKSTSAAPVVNHKIAEHYYNEFKKLSDTLNINSSSEFTPMVSNISDTSFWPGPR